MSIKKIEISGFKSYLNLILTESQLSPNVNVFVGKNGSGKSNIFHAINFVLRGVHQHLTPAELQSMLHEGSGHQVRSAFVELTFDNSQNRFSVSVFKVQNLLYFIEFSDFRSFSFFFDISREFCTFSSSFLSSRFSCF